VQLSGKAQKMGYTLPVIAVIHQCLCAKTHPGGKVVGVVIIFVFPLAAIACLTTVVT